MREERRDYRTMVPRAPEGDLVDVRGLLPGSGPLELDVGFGRGMSLFTRLATSESARILGIELKAKLVHRVEARRVREGHDRLLVWAEDIRALLPRLGPPGVFARASFHFPDPWWKKRHTKRRVVGADVVGEIARLLAPGGELYVQTDVEDRAQDYVAVLKENGRFTLEGEGGLVRENPVGAVSNRERRAVEDGLPVFRVLARRVP